MRLPFPFKEFFFGLCVAGNPQQKMFLQFGEVFLQFRFFFKLLLEGIPVQASAFPPSGDGWKLGNDFPVGERAPAASSGAAPPASEGDMWWLTSCLSAWI